MTSANEKAYKYIKDRICNGYYKPTQRLIESQLADEIGVSRNTIKNTLLKIENEKLIVMEKNKGAYVRSLEINEIDQYMEIREALEVMVIHYAIENITDEDVNRLEEILSKMTQHATERKYDDYSKLNRQFHKIIYDASKHEIMVNIILEIKTQMTRSSVKTMYVPDRAESSIKEHTYILEAIRQRNADKAEEAIRRHTHAVWDTIHKYKDLVL